MGHSVILIYVKIRPSLFFSISEPVFCALISNAQSSIAGIVHDAKTNIPLEFSSISVYSVPDSSLINGSISDAGDYSNWINSNLDPIFKSQLYRVPYQRITCF
ncbi:hypothetical protein V8V91_03405 [Algoriphagus halophilus]|uniref:hypothetical protein n=1 Tax=Algoriphagus halophilus TaxID=226505 RepID=UPI00358F79C3